MWFVLWLAVWSIYVIAGALICRAARRVADAERTASAPGGSARVGPASAGSARIEPAHTGSDDEKMLDEVEKESPLS